MRKFIKKIVTFIMLFLVTLIAVVLFDYYVLGNQHLGNYEAAILDKTARLNSIDEPKIILVGNSSLAFGMDSKMLEEAMGMPVVNMGLHGALGNAFCEDMAKAGISEGDIVVVCHLDYSDDDSIEDPALALITVEKHRELWPLIRLKDCLGIARAYPDYFKDCIMYKYTKEDDNTPEDTTCYSRSAFNEYGDICRRFKDDDNFEFFEGCVTVPEINMVCINRLNKLNEYVTDHGAVMVIAGYPIGDGEYTPDRSEYEEFERQLRSLADCEVISHFTDYFIPYEYFYDTRYHLDDQGVQIRTEQLIEDLHKWMGPILKTADRRM